jgi:hypothetical protein
MAGDLSESKKSEDSLLPSAKYLDLPNEDIQLLEVNAATKMFFQFVWVR